MKKPLRYEMLAAIPVAFLALAPVAFAAGQDTGTTSGPAAKSNVVPNTAAGKQQTAQGTTNGSSTTSVQGSVGAGAPGTEAKQGTEAGTAPSTTNKP